MSALRLIGAVAVLLVAGCGSSSQVGTGERQVVASFYPIAYAAEQVGGANVEVTNLTPPGAEPHDIELTARDVGRVRDADVVLYLDSGFQPAVEDAVEGASGTVVDLLQKTESDPHVWLDPVLYARIVRRIGDELGAPGRAATLAARLEALDREFERGLAHCKRRQLVTSHAAFGYLARRYGLEQVPITGIAPETEPTPRQLEDSVERVRETGATTVFFETLVSPRVAETVARETGASTAVLNPLEGLTEGEAGRGEDYFSVMRANLAALRKALACR